MKKDKYENDDDENDNENMLVFKGTPGSSVRQK
jgi:hypothetical protein